MARAATAEIENYSQVMLNVQPEIMVSGQAVADLVHLLAELIENATMFSPQDRPVHVNSMKLAEGGRRGDPRRGDRAHTEPGWMR